MDIMLGLGLAFYSGEGKAQRYDTIFSILQYNKRKDLL